MHYIDHCRVEGRGILPAWALFAPAGAATAATLTPWAGLLPLRNSHWGTWVPPGALFMPPPPPPGAGLTLPWQTSQGVGASFHTPSPYQTHCWARHFPHLSMLAWLPIVRLYRAVNAVERLLVGGDIPAPLSQSPGLVPLSPCPSYTVGWR